MSAVGPLPTSDFFEHIGSFAADVNLLAASTDTANGFAGSPSRVIVPDSTGNLSVVRARDGVTVVLPVTAGVSYAIQAKTITAANTTVTGAMVYW